MRVLFLSAWFPYPLDNGSKIRVYHLLRSLCARHEVTLVSFTDSIARPESAAELATWCETVRTVAHPGYRLRGWGRWARFLSPSPVATWALAPMTQLVRHLAKSSQFDTVVASTESMATYARHHSVGSTRILEEHNCFTRMMWDRHQLAVTALEKMWTLASWEKTRRYERRAMAEFDLVTMVSEQDRATCTDVVRHRGRVETVPNGVDCDWHQIGSGPRRKNALIYTGALTYSANHDAMGYFAQGILPLIRRQEPQAYVTVTGATDGVDLSHLSGQPGIRFSGYVDDIRPLVRESTACVVPLRRGGGTRLKILEAMALGTPVVSTAKGAEGLDVVTDQHLLIADDPSEFAEATVRLLRNEELRQRLAQNARRLVEERYDWAGIGARFVDLVEEAAGKGSRKAPSHA